SRSSRREIRPAPRLMVAAPAAMILAPPRSGSQAMTIASQGRYQNLGRSMVTSAGDATDRRSSGPVRTGPRAAPASGRLAAARRLLRPRVLLVLSILLVGGVAVSMVVAGRPRPI